MDRQSFAICGFVLLVLASGGARAASFSSTQNGDWDNGGTWGNTAPGVEGTDYPGAGDDASVGHAVDLTQADSCATLVVTASGTLDCQGYDLTVSGTVTIAGTLDAHSNGDPTSVSIGAKFHIQAGGMYQATAGTTILGDDFELDGSFRHNQGTLSFTSDGDGHILATSSQDFTGANAIYNLTGDLTSGFTQSRIYKNVDIEHDLFQTGGPVQMRFYANNQVITFGTDSYASQVSITYFDSNAAFNNITVQSRNQSYPAVFTSAVSWPRLLGQFQHSYMPSLVRLKWLVVEKGLVMPNEVGRAPKTLILEGDCEFASLEIPGTNTFVMGDHNATFTGDLTIGTDGTFMAGSGTATVGASYTNDGTFACGTSTVVVTNTASVANNNQPFYNLTADAGAGTVTLEPGTVSTVSNLLRVASGTCHTDDNLNRSYTGDGTFVPLGMSSNTIVCGAQPQVDAGATLEAGWIVSGGTVVMIR